MCSTPHICLPSAAPPGAAAPAPPAAAPSPPPCAASYAPQLCRSLHELESGRLIKGGQARHRQAGRRRQAAAAGGGGSQLALHQLLALRLGQARERIAAIVPSLLGGGALNLPRQPGEAMLLRRAYMEFFSPLYTYEHPQAPPAAPTCCGSAAAASCGTCCSSAVAMAVEVPNKSNAGASGAVACMHALWQPPPPRSTVARPAVLSQCVRAVVTEKQAAAKRIADYRPEIHIGMVGTREKLG